MSHDRMSVGSISIQDCVPTIRRRSQNRTNRTRFTHVRARPFFQLYEFLIRCIIMSNLIASRSHRVAPKRSSRHLRGGVTIDTATFDIDITEALEIRGPGSARKSIPSPADVPRLQSTRFCLLENRERNTITASASTSQVDGTLSR